VTPDPVEEPSAEPVRTPEPESTFCLTTPPPGGIKALEWQLKCGDGVIATPLP
jgi:hypothetical protein